MEETRGKVDHEAIQSFIEENEEYIDWVAVEAMKSRIHQMPAKSFKDDNSIAKISYNQALAMLAAKRNLARTIVDTGLFNKLVKGHEL